MTEPADGPGGGAAPDADVATGSPSLIELILTILKSLGALLSGKLLLAEREVSQDIGTLVRAAGLVVGVVVLVILALGLAGAGLAMLLVPWVGSPGGALLLVAGIYLLGGLLTLAIAWNRIRKMGGLLSESRADLKRDAEWLKNLS
ncbi:MAG: phage holin family protein [Acidobacteria bacterium]|nr:phage holin family protein [Acidobacteriota bacterium]